MNMRCFFAFVGCAIIAALLCGCGGEGSDRAIVSGTVTYQGKPIADGQIRFVPTKGGTGPVSVAPIVDGQYCVKSNGGVPATTQKVEILAFRIDPKFAGQTAPPIATIDGPPKQQYLPAKYNSLSELEMVVQSGQGEIQKNFDLSQ